MNEDAAKSFWLWFEEQEDWIINCIVNHDSAFVWAIDERLKPVFPYFKGELEFQLGYNNEVGEFFFFHFGEEQLIRDGDAIDRHHDVDSGKGRSVVQGRVFGLLGAMYSGFLPVGMAVFGSMADRFPLQAIMIGSGIGLLVLSVFVGASRQMRQN